MYVYSVTYLKWLCHSKLGRWTLPYLLIWNSKERDFFSFFWWYFIHRGIDLSAFVPLLLLLMGGSAASRLVRWASPLNSAEGWKAARPDFTPRRAHVSHRTPKALSGPPFSSSSFFLTKDRARTGEKENKKMTKERPCYWTGQIP